MNADKLLLLPSFKGINKQTWIWTSLIMLESFFGGFEIQQFGSMFMYMFMREYMRISHYSGPTYFDFKQETHRYLCLSFQNTAPWFQRIESCSLKDGLWATLRRAASWKSWGVCVFGGFVLLPETNISKASGKPMAWKMTFLSFCGESWPIFWGVLPMLVSGEGYMFLNFLGCQRETLTGNPTPKMDSQRSSWKSFLVSKRKI